MRFTEFISEAGSPKQQAAIAIAMKKAGKKPKGVAEGTLNELSSDLLKRSAQAATDKRNQAMDPELHNALGGGYMNPLARHYDDVSQKMDNRAAQVRKKETIQNTVSKIASPAVMRKMGIAKEGVAEGFVPINTFKMPTDPASKPEKVERDYTPKYDPKVHGEVHNLEWQRQQNEKRMYNVVRHSDRKVINPEPIKGQTAAEEFMKQNGLGLGNADLEEVSTIRFHVTGIDANGERVWSEPLPDMKDVYNFYKQHGIDQFARTTSVTNSGGDNVTEGLPGSLSKSDYTPGATVKNPNTSCKRCNGRGTLWKAPDGKILPANDVPGAKKYKCGACDGIGMAKKEVDEGENWSKHNNKRAGGMSKKSVSVYRREHPGSKIQTAVTTKPSKLKKGSKSAKRRASFCARMRGMKKHRTGAKTAHDPNSNINKSLRRWHCESIEELHELVMIAEQFIRNNKK
jgi:hypothetical protein